MSDLQFVWDSRKAKSNAKKHGVTFEEAETVFFDESALLLADPDHSEEEDRFILLGASARLRLLVVCHCYRESESTIRLFSARKADREERRQYKERCRP
ncbi:MAG: BrnT family toxin [Acidobacteria bacterium]|uniref:BrnT family toxin n=1 Tax=Candidatus Polarisedimenticola svalbardensis TaxID=2886004 RepID=A0A8J6Y6A6_9BACT|nr:BrnT family toxin [Candidatus Polarisedimenticola svalbardensis]